MRTPLPLLVAVAAASALVLAGCSSTPEPAATEEPAALSCEDTPAGAAVGSVTVDGEFGAKPTVNFTAPVSVESSEKKVVIKGTGDETAPSDSVAVELTLFNATSGEQLAQTRYDGLGPQQIVVDDSTGILPGIVRAIECVNVGSRVVTVVAPEDGFGEAGSTDAGVAGTDSLLLVADVLSIMPEKATGADQEPVDGMPTVELADDGTPTLTIPDADAPAELQLATLKQGDGEVVVEGDTVSVQYQGTNWRTGEVFDQSWGKSVASFATTGVVPGFSAALVGHAVGSQMLVVVPPAEGYGEAGQPDAGIEGTDTLVFVVDILATTR
ncbi:peptidylprolyl isomerase [Mycetocola sp. CAN_C7]|uniref:FKBP-type peptidyl-prolyl cis-trans isomerase n=1 Tax=Mycetocola sp. CAN_C7 TaxID=2787724 RepID=UPI0018CBEA0B